MKGQLITDYYQKKQRASRVLEAQDDNAKAVNQTFDRPNPRPSTSQASANSNVSPSKRVLRSSTRNAQNGSQSSLSNVQQASASGAQSERSLRSARNERSSRGARSKRSSPDAQSIRSSSGALSEKSLQNSVRSPQNLQSERSRPQPAHESVHRPASQPAASGRPSENDSQVILMRKVFEQAQYTQQSDACIRALHRLVAEFEFHVFYEEFCRNTKCALQFEHANPKVKNILTTISSFLLSAKKKYSTENLKRQFELGNSAGQPKKSRSTALDSPADDEDCENDENHENDENRDVNNQQPGAALANRSENPNVSIDEISLLMMNQSAGAKVNGSKGSASSRIPPISKTAKRSKPTKSSASNVSANSSCSSGPPNAEEQQLQKIYRLFRNLLDFVISDVLLPFLGSTGVNSRLNAAFLLLKLVNAIEDLDVSLFGRLRSGLLERLIDKSPKVRSTAAVLLYRFQDHQLPNDAVQDGLVFHLKYDSSPPVRLACLNVILANKDTLPAILSRVRDPNDHIREKAFSKLAKKIDFKEHLNREQRLFLIRNGLNDRSQSVRQAFGRLVVPAWIRAYADNLVDLLRGLDLINQSGALNANEAAHNEQANDELIEQFLANHFESTLSASQSSLSKLHLIIVDFAKHYLDDELLVKSAHFNAETFFLWRALIKFFKSREDALDRVADIAQKRIKLKRQFVQLLEIETERSTGGKVDDRSGDSGARLAEDSVPTVDAQSTTDQLTAQKAPPAPLERSAIDENNNETGNSENLENTADELAAPDLSGLAEQEDFSLLDLVMPKFSRLISFFRSFCEHLNLNVDEKDENADELLCHRFMFRQLIGFLDNYEIADDSQRTAIADLVEELFELNENTIKIRGYSELIMNFAYQTAYRQKKKQFFEYSMELLQRLEAKINLEEQRRNSERISAKEIRDLELTNANQTIRIHELKDQLDEAVAGGQFDRAHELQLQIECVKQECNRLWKEILRMKNVLEYQENRRKAEENGESAGEFDISNYPVEHIKLLQIFEIALRNGLNNFHSLVNYGIDRYILPGITSTDRHVRLNALMALNEACCLNLELAGKFCRLYFEISKNDNDQIRNCALQGLIDQLIEHGADLFYGCLEGERESTNPEEHPQTAGESKMDQQESGRTPSLLFGRSGFCSDAADRNDATERNDATDRKDSDSRNDTEDRGDSSDKSEQQQQNETLINKSQFIELSATSTGCRQLIREQLVKDFTRFLLGHTKAEDERMRCTSVMGICKLMMLGRIYSPKLLSELILLWFNASTSQWIQQDIGTFLPIYCLEQSTLTVHLSVSLPTHLTGQHSLLECFMVTVENVYRLERGQQLNSSFLNAERSNYYDSNIDVLNVIDFMLNLLEPANHAAIAIAFAERILDVLRTEREDEYMLREAFITKYLIRSLHLFRFGELSAEERQRLNELLQAIRSEDRYSELKKSSTSKIEKFMHKFS